jgi:hypothetical protein
MPAIATSSSNRVTDFLDRLITLDMGDECADSRLRNGDARLPAQTLLRKLESLRRR